MRVVPQVTDARGRLEEEEQHARATLRAEARAENAAFAEEKALRAALWAEQTARADAAELAHRDNALREMRGHVPGSGKARIVMVDLSVASIGMLSVVSYEL